MLLPLTVDPAAPAEGSDLAAPSALFDPSNRLLGPVFGGEPLFPAAQFAGPAWIKASLTPFTDFFQTEC